MSSVFQVGKRYSFYTLAPSILGARYNNLTLKGVFSYEIASTFSSIKDRHKQVYPLLPQGTSDQYTNYTYYYFTTVDNNPILLAEEWIDTNSIQSDYTLRATINIENILSTQVPLLRDILTTNGFTNYTITTNTTNET